MRNTATFFNDSFDQSIHSTGRLSVEVFVVVMMRRLKFF